jgi:glycosyltransferase involved in cell wall biosynthesis
MTHQAHPSPAKAILFAYYFPPDNTSGVQRAVRIAKYLPRCGVGVSVIASSHAGRDPNPYAAHHVPAPELRTAGYQKSLAHWLQRIIPYNERLEWVPHALLAARHLMAQENITAVISTSPPVATHIAAFFLKKRHGLRWVADFRDPIYGNPGRARRWARVYDLALERSIFRSADALVAVTDAVCDQWRARYPRWRDKMHLVWNGFDPEDSLSPLPIPPRDERVVAHIGVLYWQRHPYALVTALESLISNGRLDPHKIRLLFLGPVQRRDSFESHAGTQALLRRGCLEIRDELVPRAEANRVMATADFLLLLDIVNLSSAAYTVPAKIYDYILMGRPILAVTGRNSPVERILSGSGVPHVCLYHTDPQPAAEEKLLGFLQLPSEAVAPSARFLENFDGQRQAALFRDLVRQSGTPPNPPI